jgi:tRNA-specific adenosine deaminase 1
MIDGEGNQIAACVLRAYHDSLLSNGKPQLPDEFTVLAAVVAKITQGLKGSSSSSVCQYQVISIGTGTKCVGEELIDSEGYLIHDSHAEIIARRGFLRFMLNCLITLQRVPSYENHETCPFMRKVGHDSCSVTQPRFCVKPEWKFYLYISDSPCGDASIYSVGSSSSQSCEPETMAFTGAKLTRLHSESPSFDDSVDVIRKDNGVIVERGKNQRLGCCRLKSSRSDIRYQTNSMSCSDKICRWQHFGIQG